MSASARRARSGLPKYTYGELLLTFVSLCRSNFGRQGCLVVKRSPVGGDAYFEPRESAHQPERTTVKLAYNVMLFAAAFVAQSALAADADNGKRLAQQHCSPCHIVEPGSRRELAN